MLFNIKSVAFGAAISMIIAGSGALAAPVTVSNASFESGAAGDQVADGWTLDFARTVTAQDGVTPLDGERMLQFISTSSNPNGGNTLSGSEIIQQIDLSAFADEISSGEATLSASAFFNRIAIEEIQALLLTTLLNTNRMGDEETDTAFLLEFRASPGVTLASSQLISDNDPMSWEELTLDYLLPVDFTSIYIAIVAQENIFNDMSGEFDGHFADLVTLTLTTPSPNEVPLPAALPLFVLGAGVLGAARRRRRPCGKA